MKVVKSVPRVGCSVEPRSDLIDASGVSMSARCVLRAHKPIARSVNPQQVILQRWNAAGVRSSSMTASTALASGQTAVQSLTALEGSEPAW